jgi:hypothetical protein
VALRAAPIVVVRQPSRALPCGPGVPKGVRVARLKEWAIFAALFGVAACSPAQPDAATAPSKTSQPTVTTFAGARGTTPALSATGAPGAPVAAAPCIGLAICPPPPPDAEGNPGCYYRDGWAADTSGSGIDLYYFRESVNAVNGEQVTADVRLKDGTTASQIAAIDPGQLMDQIKFPGVAASAVQEVLLTTGAGRCFVLGPNG